MKKTYEKPIVEVMDARVEKGFAGSGSESGTQNFSLGDEAMFGVESGTGTQNFNLGGEAMFN